MDHHVCRTAQRRASTFDIFRLLAGVMHNQNCRVSFVSQPVQASNELAHFLCRVLLTSNEATCQGIEDNEVRSHSASFNVPGEQFQVFLVAHLDPFQQEECWRHLSDPMHL